MYVDHTEDEFFRLLLNPTKGYGNMPGIQCTYTCRKIQPLFCTEIDKL